MTAEANDATVTESARTRYLQSVADGSPLSGAALAREFGMTPRWGQKLVAAAKANEGEPARLHVVEQEANSEQPVRTPKANSERPVRTPKANAANASSERPKRPKANKRRWYQRDWLAFGGFVVGVGASVSMNVAAVSLDGAVGLEIVLGALVPVALLFVVEIVTRRGLPARKVRKVATGLGALIVGAVGAYASFTHSVELFQHWGADVWLARSMPILFDGLMLVAGAYLLDGDDQ